MLRRRTSSYSLGLSRTASPTRKRPNSIATSAAVGRSAGFHARQARQMACRSLGTPTVTSRRNGGDDVAMASSTCATVPPLNGGWPVRTLNITPPKENTSEAGVSGWSITCSGEAYSGVPANPPFR